MKLCVEVGDECGMGCGVYKNASCIYLHESLTLDMQIRSAIVINEAVILQVCLELYALTSRIKIGKI